MEVSKEGFAKGGLFILGCFLAGLGIDWNSCTLGVTGIGFILVGVGWFMSDV